MTGTIQGIPLEEFFKVNGIPFDEYYERDGVRICLKPIQGTSRSEINAAISSCNMIEIYLVIPSNFKRQHDREKREIRIPEKGID